MRRRASDATLLVEDLATIMTKTPTENPRRAVVGGIVAFGEFNFLPESFIAHPPTPSSENLWAWMQAVVRGAGLDPATGYNLRNTFLETRLP